MFHLHKSFFRKRRCVHLQRHFSIDLSASINNGRKWKSRQVERVLQYTSRILIGTVSLAYRQRFLFAKVFIDFDFPCVHVFVCMCNFIIIPWLIVFLRFYSYHFYVWRKKRETNAFMYSPSKRMDKLKSRFSINFNILELGKFKEVSRNCTFRHGISHNPHCKLWL
jgi:hypothetical protein